MKKRLLFLSLCLCPPAFAFEPGEIFFDPHIAVGHNVAQGTYVMAGADLGYGLSDQLAVGVGGFWAAGERPQHDTATGGGPFVQFVQPIVSFLTASIREDIAYIDQRTPVVIEAPGQPDRWTHVNEHGVASVTSLGLHIRVSSAFGISAGYRLVYSLSNSDLGKDRSGTFLGVAIGI